MPLISFSPPADGVVQCSLDLRALYQKPVDRDAFETRWDEFFLSDPALALVVTRGQHCIDYSHKSWVPDRESSRPRVLMLFGNPAPHSVLDDVYFSYEGAHKEHRFWRVLRKTGFCDLNGRDPEIKSRFFAGDYTSPFCLGLDVLYTFPSSASHAKWSGVSGLQRLFGVSEIRRLEHTERARVRQLEKRFFGEEHATIIAFQKNAYSACAGTPYDLRRASSGQLFTDSERRVVYGTAPTRWMNSRMMQDALVTIQNQVIALADSRPL